MLISIVYVNEANKRGLNIESLCTQSSSSPIKGSLSLNLNGRVDGDKFIKREAAAAENSTHEWEVAAAA